MNFIKNNKFKKVIKFINNKEILKKSKIIKRYYNTSKLLLIDPKKLLVLKNGNNFTIQTMYKYLKLEFGINKSNKGFNFICKDNGLKTKALQHHAQLNGISFYNEKSLDMKANIYTTYTNGTFYEIPINQNEEVLKSENLKFNDILFPTMKTGLETNNNLIFSNKSLVKNCLSENLNVSINEKEIGSFDLYKSKEIQRKEEFIKEKLNIKDYELINKDNKLYLVLKKDIIKEGELIISVNFENAEEVTVERAVDLQEKMLNNKELENYLNITEKFKDNFKNNYYEYFQYNKYIKKD